MGNDLAVSGEAPEEGVSEGVVEGAAAGLRRSVETKDDGRRLTLYQASASVEEHA